MKIGVLFPSRFEEPGEFLADARAMEAAGADSVWLEEGREGLDPWLVLAAIAAVGGSLRVGLMSRSIVRGRRRAAAPDRDPAAPLPTAGADRDKGRRAPRQRNGTLATRRGPR